ncbi:MAG TPA: FtsX-like permease family protein [Solirubrobacteraceae bacterium]
MSRWQRLSLWLRWGLRDARRRWLQVLSIALLLGLGVGMYSAMSSMGSWRTASADASFAALQMHDLRLSLTPGSFVAQGKLSRALAVIADHRLVTAAEERLVIPTQIDASGGRRSIIVPGRIVGADVQPTVDRLATVRGRPLRTADNGLPVVQLERNFAKHYGLAGAGTLRLGGGRQVRYIGQALAPEYFIVTAPGADFGAEASFAVLFGSLPTAQRLSGQRGRVNELVLRVKPDRGALAAVQSELGRGLRVALPGIGFTFTRGSQEAARRLIYEDAQGDQQMMDIFAALLLGAAAFAAFNLVSRTIEAQRREIGIGMALGVRRRVLARRPLLLGGQVAVLGIALGIPAGFAANAWLRSVMQSFVPLPVLRTPMQVGVFAEGAALGLVVSMLATAIPLRRALAVTPDEAISVGARAAKSSGLVWMTRGLRLPGGSLSNMPLRNVLRAPRRTLMTVLGIGAVVAITLALAGVIDSFNTTLDASRAEALAGSGQRLTVDLATPQPRDSAPLRGMIASPVIGAVQPSLRLPVTLSAGGRQLGAFLEVVAIHGRLWHPTLRVGTLPAARPGLVIAERAAQDLHVRIGDLLEVRYPAPTPARRGYQLASATLPITGIHANPMRFLAYTNQSAAIRMQLGGLVDRLSVTPTSGRTADDVRRALLAVPAVTAVQGAAAMTDAFRQTMSQFTDVLVVTVAIAMIMALLIAYNSAAINAEERTREHATMFAYGISPGRVIGGNVVEALLTGTLATVVGVAVGYGILRWVVDVSMRETLPDLGFLISISTGTLALAALAGILGVTLAPLLTLGRLRRIDVPSALRVVE